MLDRRNDLDIQLQKDENFRTYYNYSGEVNKVEKTIDMIGFKLALEIFQIVIKYLKKITPTDFQSNNTENSINNRNFLITIVLLMDFITMHYKIQKFNINSKFDFEKLLMEKSQLETLEQIFEKIKEYEQIICLNLKS
eukprot:TRINITY_DN19509_c0_g1_i1.p3 TRINITY_DN19509_c0_g1~~TRINITY_DN19509_c0_g1_i1.p3  ORF type:complete len:138 (+),score=28.86 TRINITY_DN19509_c0_g1_i1:289-702(+)